MVDAPDLTNLSDSGVLPKPLEEIRSSFRIKLPPFGTMPQPTRRSSRISSVASGSEYHASEKSVNMDDPDEEEVPKEEPESPREFIKSSRGRTVVKRTYAESSENDGEGEDEVQEDGDANDLFNVANEHKVTRASSRRKTSAGHDEDEEDEAPRPYALRTRKKNPLNGFIVSDEEEHTGRYNTRRRLTRAPPTITEKEKAAKEKQRQMDQRAQRISRRNASKPVQKGEQDFDPEGSPSSGASADADGSLDDAPLTSSDIELEPEPEPEPEPEDEGDGKPYALRQRKEINYAIPPPLEELAKPPQRQGGPKNARTGGGAKGKSRLGWSASGKELGKWMGMGGDDSDSDYPTRTPRKPYGGIAPYGTGAVAGGGLIGDLASGGTPSNLGKIGDSVLADADPLGVNQNVTFDEVGGLDDHIHALKEMTLLPLLYPEVFQRFNVTPPRGVLFHGPPGTGKTLMARALAASCRTGGRQISFFMRKGADCLSKWVGEAERQLRLLFEEARNSQPSIIFFDEIDGLAPVRSSKQDQIHASIVSTLLALMDGMDGRGQVVVIGATNRPDAVDSALRRPGRFDREFYFGLPGLDARDKILSIMTRKWEGWGGSEEDQTEEKQREVKERVRGLAKLTKGYGGADLRALCTEAALNAIQRRYPQVYKSNDRLLLKPETIGVGLRDFMISIKKLVPSSARSSSSAATPLPIQFVPLLDKSLDKVKAVIDRVMPVEKKLSALEEAEFEDEGGEEGALEKEMLSQAMQTLRVYRPRVIIHGPVGMGQGYVGAAVLHHLEGYHVQSLELGTLMSDSTRTVEAAIVQLFIEAKRNQPSVIYIPSLVGWCAAVSETSRSTVRAMLDTLAPTDPILLLAVVDGRFSDLPKDVRAWFGLTKDNRVELLPSSESEREAFFEGLMSDIQRPPNRFADGMERRKRILEELPIAPPLEPRKPTAAELAVQEENDQKTLTLLKYRLGPILTELKRKFKRFTKRATEEYNFDPEEADHGLDTVTTMAIEVHRERGPNGILGLTEDPHTRPGAADESGPMNGIVMEQQQIMQQEPPLYDMDLERMQTDLFKGRYLTPQDFLDDVGKMVHNADVRKHEDLDRLHKAQAMFTATQVSIQEFDPQLKLECERMAVRERQRREERRKDKEKGKGKQSADTPPPLGARRSARNNGLQPEHPITDPVKLERRLKRQRGEAGSGPDSHGSEAETNGHGHVGVNGDGERDAKRSRLVEEDDDRDPLDTLGSSVAGSERRVHQVRFVPPQIDPMSPLVEAVQRNGHTPSFDFPPSMHSRHLHPDHYQHQHQHQPQLPNQMVIDQTPRRQGFDPSLLNPMSPTHPSLYNQYPMQSPFAPRPNETFSMPMMSNDPTDPFNSIPHPQHQPSYPQYNTFQRQGHSNGMSLTEMLQGAIPTPPPPPQMRLPDTHTPNPIMHIPMIDVPSRLHTPQPVASSSTQVAAAAAAAPAPSPTPVPEPAPMVVERTPTPPLPEFHVSPLLLSELRELLRDCTAGLNVEQLEQLRATSLGTVWRHRKEWVRDELVRELLKDVKEFIREVEEEESDTD